MNSLELKDSSYEGSGFAGIPRHVESWIVEDTRALKFSKTITFKAPCKIDIFKKNIPINHKNKHYIMFTSQKL